MDVEHRHRFQVPRAAQSAGVDGLESELFDQFVDIRFGDRVIATIEQRRALPIVVRIFHRFNADGIKGFDDVGSLGPDSDLFGCRFAVAERNVVEAIVQRVGTVNHCLTGEIARRPDRLLGGGPGGGKHDHIGTACCIGDARGGMRVGILGDQVNDAFALRIARTKHNVVPQEGQPTSQCPSNVPSSQYRDIQFRNVL